MPNPLKDARELAASSLRSRQSASHPIPASSAPAGVNCRARSPAQASTRCGQAARGNAKTYPR
jgi:hypothetical protein